MSKIVIAIDAMGGDFGPDVTVPGLQLVHEEKPDVLFQIFGEEKEIKPLLRQYPSLSKVIEIVHTNLKIHSDEKPSAALRASKGTSMRLAIEAVKEKQADAVVSSGNTGALMALSKMVLKPLAGIHRPALASAFPTLNGNDTIVLDLGANVLVDSETLAQFAVLGSVFAKAKRGIEAPTVGLLNVGSEQMKGPEHVREAAEILSYTQFPGRYYGFVEGNDIALGTVDVVVCDGYAGNIALKAIEGIGKLAAHGIEKALKSSPLSMLGALLAYFSLRRYKRSVDPRRYNGGVFLGLGGLCVKSHGGSDALGFSAAVHLAIQLAENDYIEQVAQGIDQFMAQDSLMQAEAE